MLKYGEMPRAMNGLTAPASSFLATLPDGHGRIKDQLDPRVRFCMSFSPEGGGGQSEEEAHFRITSRAYHGTY